MWLNAGERSYLAALLAPLPMLAAYRAFVPELALPARIAPTAAVIGRTAAGPGLELRGLTTLRGDGEWGRVGRNGFFAERSTVHIPARKRLPGGWLYAGNPASPLRELTRAEVDEAARAIRAGSMPPSDDLPPLDLVPFLAARPVADRVKPRVARTFVAETALLVGDVEAGDDASISYGCVLAAGDARIVLGERSNVQDNTLIVTDRALVSTPPMRNA